MKTAMQELIDELKYQFSHSDNHLQTIVDIVQKAENELFEKEKEQIIEASKNGISHGYTEGVVFGTNPRDYIVKWSENYYNQTYNN